MEFHGAKIAVFIGSHLLVYLRDDFDHIPYPGCWDFAGGGREAEESPEQCALRELEEEFGLRISPRQLQGKRLYETPIPKGWAFFFAVHLSASAEQEVSFGNEGQSWALITPEEYLSGANGIGHLQDCLRVYLERL